MEVSDFILALHPFHIYEELWLHNEDIVLHQDINGGRWDVK